MIRKTRSLASWIDAAGRQRLTAAVAKTEQTTAAEIVVMVSGRASTIEHVAPLVFALSALIVALAALARLHEPLGLSLSAFLVLGLIVSLGLALFLARLAPVQRLFTTPSDRDAQAADRAELEFYRRQLTATRARTGVLIFVALMERRVHILADKAIASLTTESTWQDGVNAVLTGIRGGDLTGGIEQALALMSPELARLAPASLDNPNEIEDQVILVTH